MNYESIQSSSKKIKCADFADPEVQVARIFQKSI